MFASSLSDYDQAIATAEEHGRQAWMVENAAKPGKAHPPQTLRKISQSTMEKGNQLTVGDGVWMIAVRHSILETSNSKFETIK